MTTRGGARRRSARKPRLADGAARPPFWEVRVDGTLDEERELLRVEARLMREELRQSRLRFDEHLRQAREAFDAEEIRRRNAHQLWRWFGWLAFAVAVVLGGVVCYRAIENPSAVVVLPALPIRVAAPMISAKTDDDPSRPSR